MANSKHVARLEKGVEAWNVWREQNLDIWPDLQGANLGWANLRRADFSEADLKMANLSGADFSGADLRETNLKEASLVMANLIGANLIGANLREANFSWADLDSANLGGANLREVNLREAKLGGAMLRGADLRRVDLRGASLRGANLREANLVKANLSGADLGWAGLVEANLRGVDLSRANFSDAKLDWANLTHVTLYETRFVNIDLTHVKGLESCVHEGPSTIDHRTLQQSGKLPLSFLRGCGLPDTFIDYLPSLLNQPIQFYSCFISYASKDEALAQRLHADLQDKGVRCWFAPEDMKIGDKIRTRIDEVIRIHDKLLLVLSQDSVASAWVEKEVETAFDKEIERKEPVLFPIRLDDAVMDSKTGWAADIRRSRHIGDFSNWKDHDEYQKGLERLLRDLEIEKGK